MGVTVSISRTKILRMHSSTLVSAFTVIKLEAPSYRNGWDDRVES